MSEDNRVLVDLLLQFPSELKTQIILDTKEEEDPTAEKNLFLWESYRALQLVAAGIQVDFRFSPRITLENANTQSSEYRKYLRMYNRGLPIWEGKYADEKSSSDTINSLLLENLQ